MKKRSFFERLAGNLRFDDSDDELEEQAAPLTHREEKRVSAPVKAPEPTPEKFVVPINREEPMLREKVPTPVIQEEVGELPVDVYETPNEIVVQTLIAGVMLENVSISITRDVLTISGKREENKTIPEDSYHIRELYWGAFARTVELPGEVEIDSVEAIERHGMLMIKMPKIDKRRKTVLKIKSI